MPEPIHEQYGSSVPGCFVQACLPFLSIKEDS